MVQLASDAQSHQVCFITASGDFKCSTMMSYWPNTCFGASSVGTAKPQVA